MSRLSRTPSPLAVLLRCSALLLLLASGVGLAIGPPVQAQDLSPEKQQALDEASAMEPMVEELSMALWDHSETALREAESSEALASALEAEGFTVTRGVADMPTAFVAEYGSGAPIIGILAEFDALPGVGNAAATTQQPRDDGVTAGHGCGHNVFGAASTSAAIALKRTMEAQGLDGTIRLYGTPAEETVVGKVYMARSGLFADLDAAMAWHPYFTTEVSNQRNLALNNFKVEFFGESAHGAADPWNGRSALDAVEMMNFGTNLMREHVKPTARIHYIIENGGGAPNVVPDRAKVWYFVRDENREQVESHYDRLLNVAEGAALATGTEHEVTLVTGVHSMVFNRPLQENVQAHLELVGAPDFNDEDQAFGREMQASLDLETTGFSTEVKPLADELEPVGGGSTDVAEVAHSVPTVEFNVATTPQDVPWHSWAVAASHGTDAAFKGGTVATKVMTLTGYDLLTDPELLQAAKNAFEEATGGEPYTSPLPPNQAPPVPPTSSGQ